MGVDRLGGLELAPVGIALGRIPAGIAVGVPLRLGVVGVEQPELGDGLRFAAAGADLGVSHGSPR